MPVATVLGGSVVSDSWQSPGLQPARPPCRWDPPGKNTGVGCHALLQGIFPTQESNPSFLHLLHWQVGCLSLVPHGKPKGSLRHPKKLRKTVLTSVSLCVGQLISYTENDDIDGKGKIELPLLLFSLSL